MADGFSFAEALQPAQPKGFSFAEAMAPPPAAADPVADSEGHLIANPAEALKSGAAFAQPVANIAEAGVKGAEEGFGTEPLGLSPQTEEGLVKAGVYNAPDEYNPLKGINKAVIGGVAAAGDLALRAGNAVFRGGQATVAQTGAELGAPQLGRDIAAIPEAFMGSPEMLAGTPSTRIPITAREVQARDGVPIMEAWNRAHTENNAAAIAKIGEATTIDGVIQAAGDAAGAPGDAVPIRRGAFPQAATDESDLFAPRPAGAEEAGRATAMGDQAEASAQPAAIQDQPTDVPVDPGTPSTTPFVPLSKEPKRLIQFLREPTTLFPDSIHATTIPGGIQDVGGDVAAAIGGSKGRPGLINNRAGRSLDDAALDAWQAGYFPEHDQRPTINDLLNAIRDDHTGNAQYSMHDADAAVAHQYAQAHNAEIERIASQTGIDPAGKTLEQFFDAVADHQSVDQQAAQMSSLESEHQAEFDKAVASGKSDGTDYGTNPPRSLAELEDEYRQEDVARTALRGAADDAGSGPVPQNAGAGQGGGGQGRGATRNAGRGDPQAGAPASPATELPTLALPPKTSADAKAIAHAWYQRADQVGGDLPPSFADKFVDAAEDLAPQTKVGQAVAGDTEVTKLIDRLQAIRGEPISLQGAQEIYEHLGDAISKEYGLQGLSKDGHNLLSLQTKFWDMIQSAGPDEISGGPQGFKAWEQGRDAWAQAMKMIDVERIINRAQLTDNPATSIKSGVRVLMNSKRIRGYNEAEIQALKDAGDRGAWGGLLHVLGSRLTAIGAGAAGWAGGPIGSLVSAGTGHLISTGARNMSTFLQMKRANNAMSVLGRRVPPPPLGAEPPRISGP